MPKPIAGETPADLYVTRAGLLVGAAAVVTLTATGGQLAAILFALVHRPLRELDPLRDRRDHGAGSRRLRVVPPPTSGFKMVGPLFVGNEAGLTRVATTQAVDLSAAVDPSAPAAELLFAHRPRRRA